jgi:Zn-dependent protease with chaperone function
MAWKRVCWVGSGRLWLLIRLMSSSEVLVPAVLIRNLSESDQVIVSVLPGSKAILNTSTINFCTQDSKLAQLIFHEIAHVLLERRRESMSHLSIYTPIMWMLITLDWRMLVGQLFVLVGLDYFFLGEVAQAREFEADRLGMILAAKAGFDPSAAAEIWGKLDSVKDRLLPGYNSLVSSPEILIKGSC